MSASLYDSLLILYPSAEPAKAWELRNDGNGDYIAEWNLNDKAPSAEALARAALVAAALAAAAADRSWRDAQLDATEWQVARHRDEKDIGLETTLSTDQFTDLLAYRQALRDWPAAMAFPDSTSRPRAPAWLTIALPLGAS